MAFEHRENSGALFRNEKRTEENKQPNAKGDAMIGGVLYEIGAWTKDGAKGKWQSLSFKRKEQQPKPNSAEADGLPSGSDNLDDLPF